MTLGSHQRSVGKSQVHLTPRFIIDALGPFDTDPCAAYPRPWDCARINYPEASHGLTMPWPGFVWLNPPFDRRVVGLWIDRMAEHDNGIALLHARTETAWFRPVWHRASAMLFLGQRLHFCDPSGRPADANSGAPAVLCAFGPLAHQRLAVCGLAGAFVTGWSMAA